MPGTSGITLLDCDSSIMNLFIIRLNGRGKCHVYFQEVCFHLLITFKRFHKTSLHISIFMLEGLYMYCARGIVDYVSNSQTG